MFAANNMLTLQLKGPSTECICVPLCNVN